MKDIAFHLEALISDCESCVRHYEEKPGTVQPQTIIDLYYKAIQRLARIVKFSQPATN